MNLLNESGLCSGLSSGRINLSPLKRVKPARGSAETLHRQDRVFDFHLLVSLELGLLQKLRQEPNVKIILDSESQQSEETVD